MDPEDDQDDIDQAAWDQQDQERELLARAPKAHAELDRISQDNNEIFRQLDWALTKIFRP